MESVNGVTLWVRMKEAAQILGLSKATVARYVDKGLFGDGNTWTMPSGERRILREAVERVARGQAAVVCSLVPPGVGRASDN